MHKHTHETARRLSAAVKRNIARFRFVDDFSNVALLSTSNSLSMLFRVKRVRSFVEIGVGTGSTLRSFLDAAEHSGIHRVEYVGFDTFEAGPPPSDDVHAVREGADNDDPVWRKNHTPMETIRTIPDDYDVACDMTLVKGVTTETLPETLPTLEPPDVIFIDGGHTYETVSHDFEQTQQLVRTGTVVALDDFICEPGVTRFVCELFHREAPGFRRGLFTPSVFDAGGCVCVMLEY